MTSAIVNLTDENSRFINIIKAHFDLKNKSDAINFVVKRFAKEEEFDPPLRPEYVRKLKRIMKEKRKSYGSLSEMLKEYE